MNIININTQNNNSLEAFKHFFQQQTISQFKGNKYYALMLFYPETKLNISNNPNKFINTQNLYFTDGALALNTYTEIPCPYSQLIDATSIQELITQMNNMIDNFNNIQWLNKHIYPFV